MNLNLNFDIKTELSEFKKNIFISKKYWLIYLIFIGISTLSMLSIKNFENPKTEIIILFLVAIVGIICITYCYSKYSEKNLYKMAFLIIIVFGLLCAFLMPVLEPSDTHEHITRAEMTSRGIIFPEYNGENLSNHYFDGSKYVWTGEGFETIQSIKDLSDDRYSTARTLEHATSKINYTIITVEQCAEQNPFYGYLPQAIGILLAKLLNLDAIWLMWLARVFNLLCYATIVSYAVKKTPIFKVPIIAVACLPMSMFQAASVSIDSMIIGLCLFVIAYFFYLCESEGEIGYKDVGIFFGLTMLLGLLKLPYLAFSFLIFGIPFGKFKKKGMFFYLVIGIFVIGIIGIMWSNYATDALWHSSRAVHYLKYNVSSTLQMNFLLSDKLNPILLTSLILESLNGFIAGNFLIYPPDFSGGYTTASNFITAILPFFMGCVFLAYPFTEKFRFKSKLVALLVLLIVYFGTVFIQFLTWSPSGQLVISGLSPRYFLPLLAIVPFVFGFNKVKEKDIEFDYYILTLTIAFMAVMPIAFVFGFY